MRKIIILISLFIFVMGCATTEKSHYEMAKEYVNNKKPKLAIEEYRNAIREDTLDVRSYFELSYVLCDNERWEEAIPLLEKLMIISPNFSNSSTLLARAYINTCKFKSDIEYFPTEIDSNNINLVYSIAVELRLNGYYDNSYIFFQHLNEDSLFTDDYYDLLSIYCSMQKFSVAINMLKRYLKNNSNQVPRRYLVMLYEKVDSLQKAEKEYDKVIKFCETKLVNNVYSPDICKGDLYYLTGKFEKTLPIWKKLKDKYSNLSFLHYNVSVLYLAMNECDLWYKCMEEAKDKFPDDPYFSIDKGFIYLAERKYTDALKVFKITREKHPLSGVNNGYVAYTLEKMGKEKESEKYWNLCILKVPNGVTRNDAKEYIDMLVTNAIKYLEKSDGDRFR